MSPDLEDLYDVIKNTNNIIMSLAELKKDNVIYADEALKIANFVSQAQVEWALDEIERIAKDAEIRSFIDEIKDITLEPITNGVVELETNVQETDKMTCLECGADMDKVEGLLLTSYPPQHKYICPKCGSVRCRTIEDE